VGVHLATFGLLADAVSTIQSFVVVFVAVYVLVIFAYVLTSFVRLPYSFNPVVRFLYDVCEPYLRLWRRLLPFTAGPIDISPMVAIVALGVVASIVVTIVNRL
jgi:YggT family protein